jgi:hypothetical protein
MLLSVLSYRNGERSLTNRELAANAGILVSRHPAV